MNSVWVLACQQTGSRELFTGGWLPPWGTPQSEWGWDLSHQVLGTWKKTWPSYAETVQGPGVWSKRSSCGITGTTVSSKPRFSAPSWVNTLALPTPTWHWIWGRQALEKQSRDAEMAHGVEQWQPLLVLTQTASWEPPCQQVKVPLPSWANALALHTPLPQLGAGSGTDRFWEKAQSKDAKEAWGPRAWFRQGSGKNVAGSSISANMISTDLWQQNRHIRFFSYNIWPPG